MEIQTKLISTIKPSSSTPKSLQKHKFSFIDQLAPPFFMPIVYFYESNSKIPNSQKSDNLKKSLSETLSTYYPLAGRFAGNLHVDCNDDGVHFFEAEANCNLSQAINNPNPKNLTGFFPYDLSESPNFCMAVQATYFRCGGVAVGILISHKIGDALSFVMFVNYWAAVARTGSSGAVPIPKFDAAAYFPPVDAPGDEFNIEMTKEEFAGKIFTFSAAKIALLRDRISGGGGRRPSRVETVQTHVWTRFLSATGMQSDPNKIYSLMQTINLRPWIDDAASSGYHFGNVAGISLVMPAAEEGGVELLQKIRRGKEAVYDGFIAQLKEAHERGMNWIKEAMGEAYKSETIINLAFTSLCGFPIYEADFGWGEPVSVETPGFPLKNAITFMDTKRGGGIKALIYLTKHDMEKFQADFAMQQTLLNSNL